MNVVKYQIIVSESMPSGSSVDDLMNRGLVGGSLAVDGCCVESTTKMRLQYQLEQSSGCNY